MPVDLDRNGRLPQLTVQVDKTNLPTNPVRVWTEITGYVRHLSSTTSGRNDEFQRTTPGTLQLVLNNRDDAGVRFETLGVKKAQWVRVQAVWQGTTYPIWQGVIEGLLRQWPQAGKDATLTLTAADSLKLCRLYDLVGETFPAQRVDQRVAETLALVGFPVGYLNATLGFTPSLYWRLDEAAGTTALDTSGNGRTGTYGAGITLSQTGALTGDADTAVSFNDTITAEVQSAYQPFTLLSKRTFMGWAKRTATTTIDTLFGQASNASPPIGASLQIQAASNLVAWATGAGGNCSWTNAWPGTGTYVHWALTYDDTTQTVELFINGVSQGPIVITAGYNTGIVPNTLVLGCRFNANVYVDPWNGAIDEFAVYEYVLSARAISTIYQTGLLAPAGTFDTDTDLCDAVVTPLSTNSDALSQLLALEGSNNGLLIANPDGTMTYQGRHWRVIHALTASVKLADDMTGIQYRDNVQYQDDDSRLANVVNVTPFGSSTPVTVRDSASQGIYFSRVNPSVDRSLLSSSTSLALSAAQWLLNKYKDPSPRVPTIVADLMAVQQRSNTFVGYLLAAVNSQRWNWKRTTASPISQDVYIEQVSHDVDPRVPAWVTTLAFSPADAESAWILADTTFGILGSTTKLAY
jgi:hypothetical protein